MIPIHLILYIFLNIMIDWVLVMTSIVFFIDVILRLEKIASNGINFALVGKFIFCCPEQYMNYDLKSLALRLNYKIFN